VNWFSSTFDDVVDKGKHLLSDGEHIAGQDIDNTAHEVGGVLSAVGLGQVGSWVDGLGDKAAAFLDPELELGQTDDPTQLIHGSPGAIEQSAKRLVTFADAFGKTSQGLQETDSSRWTGAAADSFRARYQPEPPKWHNASVACGKTAEQLSTYADAVQWAQGQARDAIAMYADGQKASAEAASTYNSEVAEYNAAAQAYNSKQSAGQDPGPIPPGPGPYTDPGEPMRQHEQDILTQARRARDTAGGSAASVVKQMTDLAPAEPGFWSQIGDDLSDAGQEYQLASSGFVSGVLTGTADIGKLLRTLNPMDPWNIMHPAEYEAGASATLAGLVNVAVHPQEIVTSLLSGATTDPADWAGKLVPQVALTLATAGGGEAAAVATDATEAGVDATALAGADATTAGADGASIPGLGAPGVPDPAVPDPTASGASGDPAPSGDSAPSVAGSPSGAGASSGDAAPPPETEPEPDTRPLTEDQIEQVQARIDELKAKAADPATNPDEAAGYKDQYKGLERALKADAREREAAATSSRPTRMRRSLPGRRHSGWWAGMHRICTRIVQLSRRQLLRPVTARRRRRPVTVLRRRRPVTARRCRRRAGASPPAR
jgi:hypothetical protein